MNKYDRDPWNDAETMPLWMIVCFVIIITLALVLGGCSQFRARKVTEYNIDGMVETITASQFQCLTDSNRTNFAAKVKGLGSASVGTSIIDAESLAEIIKALPEGMKKEILMLLGVKP